MTWSRIAGVALSVALALSAVACAPLESGPGADRVHLDNATDIAVGIYLNDAWVGTYPAGASATVALAGHGGPPFVVSVRTAAGTVLHEETISADDMRRARTEGFGWFSALGPPCGTTRLAFGAVELDPLEAQEVEPGPCP